MKEFWNKKFSDDEYVYGTAPNSFFESEINKIETIGSVLLPLEGEGRNACFAIEKGWQVDAFDFSKAGKEKAMKLCKLKKTKISYDLSSVEDYTFQSNKYDLVALIYAHVSLETRIQLHHNIIRSLKPGGKVILEAFHPRQLENEYTSGGPKNPDMLYSLKSIKKDFQELTTDYAEELEIELGEGAFHQGKGYVTRYIGTK